MQSHPDQCQSAAPRQRTRGFGPATEEPAGIRIPVVASLAVCLALVMGTWAVVSSRRVGALEKSLKGATDDNEALTKALLKVTVERDDLAKEKEALSQQLAGIQRPAEALGQALASFLPTLGAAGAGAEGAMPPLQTLTKSGRRVKISDGGAAAFYARQNGMSLPSLSGAPMPMMDPAALMAQATEMAAAKQEETLRRIREAEEPSLPYESSVGSRSEQPGPSKGTRVTRRGNNSAKELGEDSESLSSEERAKRALDKRVEKQEQVLAFQLGLSREQRDKTLEAMKEVAAGLFPLEKYPEQGQSGDSGAAAEKTNSPSNQDLAKDTAEHKKSADLFATRMRGILSDDQFRSFESWQKKHNQDFDAREAALRDAAGGGSGQ